MMNGHSTMLQITLNAVSVMTNLFIGEHSDLCL